MEEEGYFEIAELTDGGRPNYWNEEIEIKVIQDDEIIIKRMDRNEIEVRANQVRLSTHRMLLMGSGVARALDLEKVSNIRRKRSLFTGVKIEFSLQYSTVDRIMQFKNSKYLDKFFVEWEKQLMNKSWLVKTISRPISQGVGIHRITSMVDQKYGETAKHKMNNAFEDLNSLMTFAAEMVEIAKQYGKDLNKQEVLDTQEEGDQQTVEFGKMVMDMGISGSVVTRQSAGGMYFQELARQLTDFLKKPIERNAGMITLIDAYCLYNKARGTDLISPDDLLQACQYLEILKLPMRLVKFQSGVIVLTNSTNNSSETLLSQCDSLLGPSRGITAVEVSKKLGISVILAKSRLEEAVSDAVLCQDNHSHGVTFFKNRFPEFVKETLSSEDDWVLV